MTTIFVNGRFVDDAAQATLSALDAGVQHGVGLFETMLGVKGRVEPVVLGLEHVRRLIDSAAALGLSAGLREGALYEAVVETFRRSGLERARVRLTATGGGGGWLPRRREEGGVEGVSGRRHDPTVVIVAEAAREYGAEVYGRGVVVGIAAARPSALAPHESHKTLNYWWRLSELSAAAARGVSEALVFDTAGRLVGGCVSNVFLVKGGELLTPRARGDAAEPGAGGGGGAGGAGEPSATLPGITRQWVMHTAAGLGVLTRTGALTIDDVLGAEEVLATNSSWGVLPVVGVEAHGVGGGVVGPVGRELMRAWEREVAGA